MPRKLSTTGCLRTPSFTTSNRSSVWITDALLAETYHNFARGHCRYGSNVPGPLEARRRANKRRSTSLAYAGSTGAPIDPALVFSSGPPNGWWQQKTAPASAEPRKTLLPAWLFKPLDSPASSTTNVSQRNGVLEVDVIEDNRSRQQRHNRLRELFQRDPSVDLLRQHLSNLEITLRSQPDLADHAFRVLLKLPATKAAVRDLAIADFISDPALNPPGTDCHLLLVEALCEKQLGSVNWGSILFPAILKSIHLGIVTAKSLKKIILLIPKVCSLEIDAEKADDGRSRSISEWHDILSALEDCRVLTRSDFGPNFMKRWYHKALDEWLPHRHDEVFRLLQRLNKPSSRHDTAIMADLLIEQLKLVSSKHTLDPHLDLPLLQFLPRQQEVPTILHTTIKLAELSLGGNSRQELTSWLQVLPRLLPPSNGELSIDRPTWDEALAIPSTLSDRAKFLVLVWVISHMSASRSEAMRMIHSLALEDQILDLFTATPTQRVLSTLETLPLPGKRKIYSALQKFTDHNLLRAAGDLAFKSEISALSKGDLTQLLDDEFYFWANVNHRDQLAQLAESINQHLPAFRQLSQAILTKNGAAFRIVKRILNHNRSLKLSLSQWPATVSARNPLLSVSDSGLDPKESVALIHALATTVAVSPVISHRSAFNQVYYFYRFLQTYHAPIYGSMSRALWHAGVARYGSQGVATAQVQWCLSQVQAIEGKEVSANLLWNAGFREKRLAEMTRFARALQTTLDLSLKRATHNLAGGSVKNGSKQSRVVNESLTHTTPVHIDATMTLHSGTPDLKTDFDTESPIVDSDAGAGLRPSSQRESSTDSDAHKEEIKQLLRQININGTALRPFASTRAADKNVSSQATTGTKRFSGIKG